MKSKKKNASNTGKHCRSYRYLNVWNKVGNIGLQKSFNQKKRDHC